MTKPSLNFLRGFLCLIFLIVGVNYFRNHHEDFQFLLETNWAILFPVFLIAFITFFISAFRFRLVLKEAGHHLSISQAFRHVVISRSLNKFIPQSGWIFKARSLQRENNMRLNEFVSTFGAFVWLEVFVATFVASSFLLILDPSVSVRGYRVIYFLIGLLGAQVIATAVGYFVSEKQTAKKQKTPQSFMQRLLNTGQKIIKDFIDLVTNPRLSILSSVIVLVGIAMSVARMYLLFRMIGLEPGFGLLTLFVAVNRLSNTVVLTPGNIGFVELFFGALASSLGLGGPEGVTVALVLRGSVLLTLIFSSLIVVSSSKVLEKRVPSSSK